jgi:glutamine amidotransferase
MRLTVIDCGVNNLTSVCNAVRQAGHEAEVATTPEQVASAERLILPGVGAAFEALSRLRERSLDQALEESVRRKGRPLLGVCLGMHMLAERLFEFGEHRGLGWIAGDVVSLSSLDGFDRRCPHMGWNPVEVAPDSETLFGKPRGERSFYFCHSYTLRTPEADRVAATASHGVDIVAAIRFDTVFATQFHPERSHANGSRLIEAFSAWAP